MGDGKEKRKIHVIVLQSIDLPITDAPVFRGNSKPFPSTVFGISPIESMILIVKKADRK
jgi:hypothetical protein